MSETKKATTSRPFPPFPAATQAKNMNTLMKRIHEVVELCLEGKRKVPSMELIGIQQISV